MIKIIPGLSRLIYSATTVAIFGFFAFPAYAQVVVTPTPLDLNGNGIPDSSEPSVTVATNIELPAGTYTFNDLIIANNVTLFASGDQFSTSTFKGVRINAKNLTVGTSASISADGRGYDGSGPGAPSLASLYSTWGAGASYGGVGGGNTATSTYGSATQPSDLGSGVFGYRGGGAIRIAVSGMLTNNGSISANGVSARTSGGSIYVTTGGLSGVGTFSANGAGAVWPDYFSGAGGRIAVHYATSTFTGNTSVDGGYYCMYGCGQTGGQGTAAFFDTTNNDVYLKNSFKFQSNDGPFNVRNITLIGPGASVDTENGVRINATSIVAQGGSFAINDAVTVNASDISLTRSSRVLLSGAPILNIPTVNIDQGSTLSLSGNEKLTINALNIQNGGTLTVSPQHTLNIKVPNLIVGAGSFISADLKGYSANSGPGAPVVSSAGASYGGIGFGNTATSTYGSSIAPTDMGSGGGGYYPSGGGAVRLVVTDTFLNNGTVSADGSDTSSGGSVYVTANKLAGLGSYHANGGGFYCPNTCVGMGGGGRVALYYATSTFAGQVSAKGGCNSFDGWTMTCAGNGTVIQVMVNTPPTITLLGQFKSDGITPIIEGGITAEPTIVLKATLADVDNDQVKLQIELKPITQTFDGTALLESGFVASGNSTSTIKYSLSDGLYHWRARAVDDRGNMSAWQEFGVVGNTDFEVQLPLNIKAAELAKQLVNQNYLWGGKGWDMKSRLFVTPDTIKTGYNYWNPNIANGGGVAVGNGVDCSGLTAWSYNRAVDPLKYFTSNFITKEGADGQYKFNMQATTTSDVGLQPGDLIFFDWGTYSPGVGWNGIKDGHVDHVAMYVGNQGNYDVIEALNGTSGIKTTTKQKATSLSGFVSFGRPKNATIAMSVVKHSPVHLSVTDPTGNTISDSTGIATDEEYIRESGDLFYATMGIDTSGYPEDVVYSPTLKQGTYRIRVSPMASTTPNQTYSLDFTTGSTTIPLAQNVPLSQIPITGGYGVVIGANNSITLDTTPPEAHISFGTSTKSLLVEGIDDLSSTTVLNTATTTALISDESGNTLKVVFNNLIQTPYEIKRSIQSLTYNGTLATTTPQTTLHYIWATDDLGNIVELEQSATIDALSIVVHYYGLRNETVIDKVTATGVATSEVVPGIRLIKLITNKGNVTAVY